MIKNTYEFLRPLIIWLGLTELVWIAYWLLRNDSAGFGYTATVVGWFVALLAWMAWVIHGGRRGLFLKHTRWLSNLVGAVTVVAFSAALFMSVPGAWEELARTAALATTEELASIHILRLLAVGTIVKYLQRQLPLHFFILGSLPDFLFAISAIIVAFPSGDGFVSREFLIAWHCTGALVFMGAGISMFFSVPSPFFIYRSAPDASIAFRFPMLLAPNFTVPLFMLAHAFALVKFLA